MPLQNMFVLLLGLVLVFAGFYVAWNAPSAPSITTVAQQNAFVIAVEAIDCENGVFDIQGGSQTSEIAVLDADGTVLKSSGSQVQIPVWEERGPITVTYLWAGDPGSQTINPANHC